jgi:hypothetical protein
MKYRWHIRKQRANSGLSFAVEARSVCQVLESRGFTVEVLPQHCCGFSVHHLSSSAITQLLLLEQDRFADWRIDLLKTP